jgi:predicted MFS family arabinose efflux permease
VPLVAALGGMLALRRIAPAEPERPRAERGAWRDRAIRSWALGELFANSAWAGTLVYVGALLVQSYGWSASADSFALAATALSYFPGAFAARRLAGRDPRAVLAIHALALAVGVAVFAGLRVAPLETLGAFVVLGVLSGSRSVVTSAFGLDAAPAHRVAVMSMRTATLQFGYLVGAGIGGLAIAVGGYDALAVTLATLFALGAVPHLVHFIPRPQWRPSGREDDLVAELG